MRLLIRVTLRYGSLDSVSVSRVLADGTDQILTPSELYDSLTLMNFGDVLVSNLEVKPSNGCLHITFSLTPGC